MCSVSQRSTVAWTRCHRPGPLPKKRPRRCAMSGDSDRLPRTNSLTVARGPAREGEIPKGIMALIGQPYEFLKQAGLSNLGINVVIYWNEPNRNLLKTDEGVPMEVGVQVPAPF